MSATDEAIDVTGHEHEGSVAALTPAVRPSTALVEPAASSEATLQAFHAYNKLCEDLLIDEDYQAISGKRFRKKSGWRKLAVAFGVSCELLDRDHERAEDGRIVRTEIVVRATAPNGRFMDGIGACDLYERCCERGCTKNHGQYGSHCPGRNGEHCDRAHFSHAQHDIPATAMTRATNRACADLFGMGEVSAEEVTDTGVPVSAGTDTDAPPAADEPVVASEAQLIGVLDRLRPIRDCLGGDYPEAWKAEQPKDWGGKEGAPLGFRLETIEAMLTGDKPRTTVPRVEAWHKVLDTAAAELAKERPCALCQSPRSQRVVREVDGKGQVVCSHVDACKKRVEAGDGADHDGEDEPSPKPEAEAVECEGCHEMTDSPVFDDQGRAWHAECAPFLQ